MVHLDKVTGQRGYIVIQEDGTILSSSGELSSNELTSNQISSLMSHSLPVDFSNTGGAGNAGFNGNGEAHEGEVRATPALQHANANGSSSGDGSNRTFKWNKITVKFGDESYVACLSNRRIHVVKRDNTEQNMQ